MKEALRGRRSTRPGAKRARRSARRGEGRGSGIRSGSRGSISMRKRGCTTTGTGLRSELGEISQSGPDWTIRGGNLHAYAENPVEWIDPLGLAKKKPCQTRANSTEPKLPEKVIAADGGLRLEHYVRSGDHAPAHFHLRGENGLNVQVGQNGKPLDSKVRLTAAQEAFVLNNRSKLRSGVDKIQRWHRYQNLPNDCTCCN